MNAVETKEERMVCLKAGAERMEVALDRVTEFLMNPKVIRVPLAPAGVAGVMEYRENLIAAFCLGGSFAQEPGGWNCAAVFEKQEGGYYAILAEEID